MPIDPAECRERIEECQRQSVLAIRPEDKEHWLRIARAWMLLAEPTTPSRTQ